MRSRLTPSSSVPALMLALLLSACDGGDAEGRTDGLAGELSDGRIECRIGEARRFERSCTVEPGESEVGRILVLRKPDGGFRRLLVATDGRGVVAADGAEPAQVRILDAERIEVAIGSDAFRLPARVQAR